MAKISFSKRAVDDLTEIWDYTSDSWSEKQADKYYEMLLFACSEVAENQRLGKKYDEVDAGLLGYKINKHIIFYEVISETEILVIRILHSSMDIGRRLEV